MSVKPTTRGSALDGFRQSGSMKCLFPRPESGALQAVLVNTAGGITGGDRFTIAARAGQNTSLVLATQAAERAYRAKPGETGRVRTELTAGAGARIDWLPQETILFDGCALDRALCLTLDPGASALVVEPLVFGRAAMGETVEHGFFRDRIEIRRGDAPLYLDATRYPEGIRAHLDRPNVANGARAMATLIYVAPDAETHLSRVRAHLPDTAGASLIGPDVLVLRLLAADGYALRQSLIPAVMRLTQDRLPRCWMI